MTGGLPSQRASDAEKVSVDDIMDNINSVSTLENMAMRTIIIETYTMVKYNHSCYQQVKSL